MLKGQLIGEADGWPVRLSVRLHDGQVLVVERKPSRVVRTFIIRAMLLMAADEDDGGQMSNKQVRDEVHLVELMEEPDWTKLYDKSICTQLIHVNNHYDTLRKMPELINSIPRLAMFLAVIRPAKRHLIGKTWKEVSETIWDKVDGEYSFKKSHAIAYANLVVVNLNLLCEPK